MSYVFPRRDGASLKSEGVSVRQKIDVSRPVRMANGREVKHLRPRMSRECVGSIYTLMGEADGASHTWTEDGQYIAGKVNSKDIKNVGFTPEDFRVGDVITVRLKVVDPVHQMSIGAQLFVRSPSDVGLGYFVLTEDVVSIEERGPEPIKVGDRVSGNLDGIDVGEAGRAMAQGKVIAMHGGYAWVERESTGRPISRPIADLRKVG